MHFLDFYAFDTTAEKDIDRLAGPRQGGRLRTTTLASPYTGASQAGPALRLGGYLRRAITATDNAARALQGWFSANSATLSASVVQQVGDVIERLAAVAEQGTQIVDDLVDLQILPAGRATATGSATGSTTATGTSADTGSPAGTSTPTAADGSDTGVAIDDLDDDNG